MNLHEELIATVEGWDVDEAPALRHAAAEIRRILERHPAPWDVCATCGEKREGHNKRHRFKDRDVKPPNLPTAAECLEDPMGSNKRIADFERAADRDVKPGNTWNMSGKVPPGGFKEDDEAPPFDPGPILETIARWRQVIIHPDRPRATFEETERARAALDCLNILEALTNHGEDLDERVDIHRQNIERAAVAVAVEARLNTLERLTKFLDEQIPKLAATANTSDVILEDKIIALAKLVKEHDKERWDLSREFGRMRYDVDKLKAEIAKGRAST